jgi:hypothetical protein
MLHYLNTKAILPYVFVTAQVWFSCECEHKNACAIIPAMPEPPPPRPENRPFTSLKTPVEVESNKVLCERCGQEMYRMHAVWRCPACGFKTDCCGW